MDNQRGLLIQSSSTDTCTLHPLKFDPQFFSNMTWCTFNISFAIDPETSQELLIDEEKQLLIKILGQIMCKDYVFSTLINIEVLQSLNNLSKNGKD